MAKNRLHQALQSTFPEIENLFYAITKIEANRKTKLANDGVGQ